MKNQQRFKQKYTGLAIAISLALGLSALPDESQANESSCPKTKKWEYLTEYNSSNGLPNGMTDSKSLIPADMITRFLKLLPEGVDITKNSTTNALITNDLGGNLFLKKKAKVKIAFLTEGAGYSNAVGYFKFDKGQLPKPCVTGETIIFPNSSAPPMALGNTVDLGSFNAGDAIGFTVVANGWSSGEVNPSQPATSTFRSVMALNPETNGANAHTVLLSSPEDKLLVLGFEDLNRQKKDYNAYGYSTDNDFNDVIMAILVDPFDAVDTGEIADVDTGTTSGGDTPPSGGDTPPGGGGDTPPGGGGSKSNSIGTSGRMNWREKVDTQGQ